MKAPTTQALRAKKTKSKKAQLNWTFGYFFFLGLTTLPFGVIALLDALHWVNLEKISSDGEFWIEIFGLTVALPLVLAMLAATIMGIWRTVELRHPALIVLSIVSIICGGGMIALVPYTPVWNGHPDVPVVDHTMAIAFGIYICANVLIPAWWFIVRRPRDKNSAVAQ